MSIYPWPALYNVPHIYIYTYHKKIDKNLKGAPFYWNRQRDTPFSFFFIKTNPQPTYPPMQRYPYVLAGLKFLTLN